MAMAIFGLVLTAIYACWTLILKSSKIGLEASARVQRERIAVRTIEDALVSARSFAADVQRYGFVSENGDNAFLSFVARLPDSFPRSGKFGAFNVRRVTFALESGADYASRELVLRQNPTLMDPDEDEKNHPLVLARDLKEMQFEFWDLQRNDWVDQWTETNKLPPLVKFTLRFAPPGQTAYSSQPPEEVTRIVAIPSATVPPFLQSPAPPGRPAPGATPTPNPTPTPAPAR